VKQLDLQISAYIALSRLTSDLHGGLVPDSANPILEPALRARIPILGPTITLESTLAAMRTLAKRVQELHSVLESLGVAMPGGMIGQVAELDQMAARVLDQDPMPPPSFR